MSAEPVAPILQCEECRRFWVPADRHRWRAYRTDDEELFFFCPGCAEREFSDN